MDALAGLERELQPGLPCTDAFRLVRAFAEALAVGQADPKRGSNDIYWAAWHAGAWADGSPCPELADWGSEFLQLADALDQYAGQVRATATLHELIRDAAIAVGKGLPLPNWRSTTRGVERDAPDR